jgi:3-deoxy-D-manno-octulosonic-acid transferase
MSVRDQLPLALRLYRLASLAAVPTLAPRFLRWRLSRGKENAARLAERYGEASRGRLDRSFGCMAPALARCSRSSR